LGTLVAALFVAAPTASAAKKPKGPVVVGTDPADDFGSNSNPAYQPLGEALGMELVEASIGMADAETVNFVIKVAALPASGGTPELVRYTWSFEVEGETLEMYGKWLNYSGSTCDPSGPCPRDPGRQPFMVRGKCELDPTLPVPRVICEELAKVQATFDAGTGTITVPVPLDAIGAKPGSKIVGASGMFGGTIAAAPSGASADTGLPLDTMDANKTFVVPKK
jgi:hypothetical protein